MDCFFGRKSDQVIINPYGIKLRYSEKATKYLRDLFGHYWVSKVQTFRKIAPNSCVLLRKPGLHMTRKYISLFSCQLRIYFGSTIFWPQKVQCFWYLRYNFALCALVSIPPQGRILFFPNSPYQPWKKPPKKYQTITSPKRQLFFIAIPSKENIFAKTSWWN